MSREEEEILVESLAMTTVGREVLDQALHLSPEDRLWVAQALWDRVDPAELARIYLDDELKAEIDRRSRALGQCVLNLEVGNEKKETTS